MFIITWSSNFFKFYQILPQRCYCGLFSACRTYVPGFTRGLCSAYGLQNFLLHPLFKKILWSVVIRCLHSIGPVYFMLGNDRLSREPWPHPYLPIYNFNHHISNYKPILDTFRSHSKQGKNTLHEQKNLSLHIEANDQFDGIHKYINVCVQKAQIVLPRARDLKVLILICFHCFFKILNWSWLTYLLIIRETMLLLECC